MFVASEALALECGGDLGAGESRCLGHWELWELQTDTQRGSGRRMESWVAVFFAFGDFLETVFGGGGISEAAGYLQIKCSTPRRLCMSLFGQELFE